MLGTVHKPWEAFGIGGLLMLGSVTVAAIGTAVGVRLFRSDNNELLGRVTKRLQPLYDGSRNRWYFDDLNDLVFVRFGRKLANALWWFDRRVVDGTVNGVASLTSSGGRGLRQIQTGRVQNYALGIALGAVLAASWIRLDHSVRVIPLGIAMDDHQTANAEGMVTGAAADVVPEPKFNVEALTPLLLERISNAGVLKARARAAWQLGRPNAAKELADLAEQAAGVRAG